MASAAAEWDTVGTFLTLGYIIVDKHAPKMARFVVRMRQGAGRESISDAEQGTANEELQTVLSNTGVNITARVVTRAQLDAMTAQTRLVPLPDEQPGDIDLDEFTLA